MKRAIHKLIMSRIGDNGSNLLLLLLFPVSSSDDDEANGWHL